MGFVFAVSGAGKPSNGSGRRLVFLGLGRIGSGLPQELDKSFKPSGAKQDCCVRR